MVQVNEIARALTLDAANTLIRTLKAMPQEKIEWKPQEHGRCALEQIVECGRTNMLVAQILNEHGMPPLDPEDIRQAHMRYDSLPKAIAALKDGTQSLLDAIESFSDRYLNDEVTMPFGGGTTKKYYEIMFMPYWNMTYHLGQINYIQTLYGDKEMH
jgi:hypothetical protein